MKTILKEEKLKNLYNPEEIEIIFKECETIDDILQTCEVLKEVREMGFMCNATSKVVEQFSLLRFIELTAKM